MKYIPPEDIARRYQHLDGVANIRAINRDFRWQDESEKWLVSGRFNATERAIRRLRRLQTAIYGLEYALTLDNEISRIVNGEV